VILVFYPRSEEPRYALFDHYFLMNLNIVTLIGRAGGDPEVKYFESGSVVCNLTLAVNRRTKKTDQPDWFNLEIWDKTAEVAANYVRKGGLIGIKGVLKFDYWQDRNTGTQRSKPVIRVYELDLLGSKRDSDEGAPRNNYDEF
jgi:single-strand DNA-binding protein